MDHETRAKNVDWDTDKSPDFVAAGISDDYAYDDAGDAGCKGIGVCNVSSRTDTSEMHDLKERSEIWLSAIKLRNREYIHPSSKT